LNLSLWPLAVIGDYKLWLVRVVTVVTVGKQTPVCVERVLLVVNTNPGGHPSETTGVTYSQSQSVTGSSQYAPRQATKII